MNCFYCGKPLTKQIELEKHGGWHARCIKKFFNTNQLPELDLSEETLRQLALESTNKGYTVPGVQKKLSLHLTLDDHPRFTLVNYPTGYILKPQTEEYAALPEAEYLVMQMAKATGIKTVPFSIIRLHTKERDFAYITKRIDRIFPENSDQKVKMLAMEDFCQLDGRLTEDKYHGSYERCARIISHYSAQPLLDLSELFLRIIFSFIIGNSDMHLKNFSLIEAAGANGGYILSPAYDMLPVHIILPEDPEELALTLNGKKRNIHKKDFLIFADTIGLPKKSAEKLMQKVIAMQSKYCAMCTESFLPSDLKDNLNQLIIKRISLLI